MKKVCVVTTTRAEYGLLRPLLCRLRENREIKTQLLVTGAHLERAYGETVQEILKDGYSPDLCVPIIMDDSPLGILKTMGNAVQYVGEALRTLQPDLLVLLGDRYETLAIASAAVVLGLPIAHLYGGEVTSGAFDEMFRHAVTKLSYLHFTATDEYRNRVIQMGESPDRVFKVGSLGVENVLNTELLSREELERQIDFSMNNTLLATYHPVTMETGAQAEQFRELLEALREKSEYRVLFTRPNADTYRNELNTVLDEFVDKFSHRVMAIDSLGVIGYLSAMKYSAGIIGNSSSGIIEAPSMHIGVINIGNRQKGRISAESVIHCSPKKDEIIAALNRLGSTEYKEKLQLVKNPYESEGTSSNIAMRIAQFFDDCASKQKTFYDLDFMQIDGETECEG